MIKSHYKKMIFRVKSTLFYAGSILAMVLYFCCFAGLVAPFVAAHKRQYIFTRYNIFVLWWCKCLFAVEYKVEGIEYIHAQPCIILCNHQSSLETFILQTLFSPLSTVLKKELLMVPFFGWSARMLKAIPVDRGAPVKAYKQLMRQGRESVLDNRSVLIFPEGTRVPIGERVKFNRGGASLAHQLQVPIIPVAHNSGLSWPPKHLALSPSMITIRVGPPIESRDKSKRELYEISTKWIESNRDDLLAQA
jgi:1-acyl-sn-glycerol-3-phosphate acyltransferase